MKLRPYQEQAIARARAAVEAGARSVLLVAPTGAGKTVILSAMVANHLAGSPERRALVVVHRRELVEQTEQKLAASGAGLGRVCVETVQSLLSSGHVPQATLVVFDEAHHYASDEWSKLAASYPSACLVGLTATPERGDGRGLGNMFDRLIVVAQPQELIELGALVPCDVIAPARRLGPGEIAQRPAAAYIEHTPGEHAIVFSPTVAIAREHVAEFRLAGVDADIVTGSMASSARDAIIGRFRSGALRVLVNCMVLTEGFDAPHASVCVLARGASTAGSFIQMAGRVLRPSPGKARAVLLDLVGATHVHGRPDEPRAYSLTGKAIRRGDDDVAAQFCLVCGAPWTPPACAECGRETQVAQQTVTGDKLEKYAAKRREGTDRRAETLGRWLIDARTRGFKPGWAKAKYRAVYGEWPSAAVVAAASRGGSVVRLAVQDMHAEEQDARESITRKIAGGT